MSAGLDWPGDTFSLLTDQYGRVWASNDHSLYRYDRSVGKLERLPGPELHGSLIQSPDGRIWLAGYDAVQPVPAPRWANPCRARRTSSRPSRAGPGSSTAMATCGR